MKIAHILYQNRQFELDILQIKNLFTDDKNKDYLLQNFNYKENVPIENLDTYIFNIWHKINNSKNIFLPDEKKMISMHFCEKLKKKNISEFSKSYQKIEHLLQAQFRPTFVNQLDSFFQKNINDFKDEACHYEKDIFDKELNDLRNIIKNKILFLCKQEIKKAQSQAQKTYNEKCDNLYQNKKFEFDNVYYDLTKLLIEVKKDCENTIKQCSYNSDNNEEIILISQKLRDTFNKFHEKFLVNYRDFATKELFTIMRKEFEFNIYFSENFNNEFWNKVNNMLQEKIDNFEGVASKILLDNYQISKIQCNDQIAIIIKDAIKYFKEFMKEKIMTTIERLLIRKFTIDILKNNEKGVPFIWNDEKDFTDNYITVMKNFNVLFENLKIFYMKLNLSNVLIEIKERVFDDNQFEEKKENIINELNMIKENTLIQIVS